ncbi:MAG: hypothetical protein U1A27_03920 [Phycisphaerae bacterium]
MPAFDDRRRRSHVATLLLAALLPCGCAAPRVDRPPRPGETPRDARWRADLAFLAHELPARHVAPFFHCPRARFVAAVAALDRDIPAFDDSQIIAGLMHLTAMIGDAHTGIQEIGELPQFAAAPLRLGWFRDGYYCVGAPAESGLHGARLTRVAATDVATIEQRLGDFWPWQNVAERHDVAPQLLTIPRLLMAAGIAPRGDSVPQTFVDAAGRERRFNAAPAPAVGASRPASGRRAPPFAEHRREPYWYEFLPDRSALYLAYNRCDDAARFRAVCGKMWRDFDRLRPRIVVVDLRRNGGGNSAVLLPFRAGLLLRPALWSRGAVRVLIGRGTYSSAMMNALELRRAGAVLVGEPTGGKPNAYGEVRTFELPHCRLHVAYSTRYFRLVPADPESVTPDVAVEPTIDDWLAGRDPVLDAALVERVASAPLPAR